MKYFETKLNNLGTKIDNLMTKLNNSGEENKISIMSNVKSKIKKLEGDKDKIKEKFENLKSDNFSKWQEMKDDMILELNNIENSINEITSRVNSQTSIRSKVTIKLFISIILTIFFLVVGLLGLYELAVFIIRLLSVTGIGVSIYYFYIFKKKS